MDCEKFETAMIDELYDELDELTSAAAKRHVAGCARCAAMLGGLRATRRVMSSAGGVPLVEPPAHLEERIFAAAREAQKVVPINKRIARAISTAGSWAMRPQTAMAAVFLLMIGSSVVFLRSKRAMSPHSVTVTAEGAPVASTEQLARSEPFDTQAASGAHGYKKMAPQAPEPTAAASVALASPTATAAADDKSGFMDDLTKGQGRGDKGGALGQLNDGDEEKQKLDKLWGPRAAGPSNAGAIGGASSYAGGGGGSGIAPAPQPASPPPAVTANAPRRSATIVADRPAANAPPPPPAAKPAPAPDPYMAPGAGSKDEAKKEKERTSTALDAARAQYANKNYADATRAFDQISASSGDPSAALWAARSVRDGSGCGASLQRFDTVAGRQAGTSNGNDALLEGGQCYRQLGQFEAARARLVRLLTVPSHAARAQRELDAMSPKSAAKPVPRKAPEPSQQQAAPPSKESGF